MVKRVYGDFYGCTLNRGEFNVVLGELEEQGWEITDDLEKADLCLIFTCIVIDKTERKVRKRIKQLQAEGKRVVVGGCLAPFYEGEKIYPALSKCDVSGIELKRITGSHRVINGTTAIVPISTGCLFNCSYCMTKLARGRLKSYPVDSIVGDVEYCLKNGAREILLTSQDCGSYGLDRGESIVGLVDRISSLDGNFMMRIGMMNPSSINGLSIKGLFGHDHVFKFLHLPLQSGSNQVLKRMGRRYTAEEFNSIVDGYKGSGGVFSTDVIVGFPGETDNDFQASVKAIEAIKPDVLNITRFSPRPGTRASSMGEKIHGRISKERSRVLTHLAKKIGSEINKEWVGKRVKVLITERKEDKKKKWMGRMANYKPVVLNANGNLGSWVETKITDFTSSYLIGE